jgi:hypothetical protein
MPTAPHKTASRRGCGAAVVAGLLGAMLVVVLVMMQQERLIGEMVKASFCSTLERAVYERPADAAVLRLTILGLPREAATENETLFVELAGRIDTAVADGYLSAAEADGLYRVLRASPRAAP